MRVSLDESKNLRPHGSELNKAEISRGEDPFQELRGGQADVSIDDDVVKVVVSVPLQHGIINFDYGTEGENDNSAPLGSSLKVQVAVLQRGG